MASNELSAPQAVDKAKAATPIATANMRGRSTASNKTVVRQIRDKVEVEGRTSLTAPEGKLVCDAYGIRVPKEVVATSAHDAAKIAVGVGFPLVLKIVSPEILHTTEAGGVIVGVKNASEVERGFAAIMANAQKHDPKAQLLGVQVQQMLLGGHEVIIGAVTDPSFGKLVAFGLRGVLVEVLKDVTFLWRQRPATVPCRCSTASPPPRLSRVCAERTR